jgi:hypothetical protein
LGLLAGLFVPTFTGVRQSRLDAGDANYAREIGQAQADLDAGRTAKARQRLDATDKSRRSFEFEYLQTRVQRAPADGDPAPDLIRKLPKPDVEVRYGVLNEINRQLVLICRDGCEKVLRLFDAATGEVAMSIERPECGAKPAFSRDGRLLGWSEPDGFRFIDLGKLPGNQEQKPVAE